MSGTLKMGNYAQEDEYNTSEMAPYVSEVCAQWCIVLKTAIMNDFTKEFCKHIITCTHPARTLISGEDT